jgi:hypothetical protein
MTDEIVVPSEGARKKPFILFRIAQWLVAALLGLFALAMLVDLSKLAIPGAPIALFWSALAVFSLAAIILSPPLFFRLPVKAKVGAYVGGLAAFVLLGVYGQQMRTAYEHTPTGAAEAKARAETEAALAKADAIAREAQTRVDAINAELSKPKAEEPVSADAQACQALVPEVLAMAKEKGAVEIFEINDVRSSYSPTGRVCEGEAITDKGKADINFSVETTPQGRTLLNMSFPHGI